MTASSTRSPLCRLPKFIFPTEVQHSMAFKHRQFSIDNLPYGVFRRAGCGERCIGVALGDKVIDMKALAERGKVHHTLKQPTLNSFMECGKQTWSETREALQTYLSDDHPNSLQHEAHLLSQLVVSQDEVAMVMPCEVGDYTDFYASKYHAANVGKLFRGGESPLLPNWLHVPVGYHGRSSSIQVSNDSHTVRRPNGQLPPSSPEGLPSFGPSKKLDYELEMAAVVGVGNNIGEPVPLGTAEDHIFGLTLMNDWSARDIQKWEYVPLGPFLGKNFATTISPWIVTCEALSNFKVPLCDPQTNPKPLDYIRHPDSATPGYDITLEVLLQTQEMSEPQKICETNLKHLYWSVSQQLTHHASNGCPMRSGDLLGTGTVSGPEKFNLACLLETTLNGSKPLKLCSGQERTFLENGDTVILRGFGQRDNLLIGFGECKGTILPAPEYPMQ